MLQTGAVAVAGKLQGIFGSKSVAEYVNNETVTGFCADTFEFYVKFAAVRVLR